MSIVEAAKNSDWAEVTRRTAAGPSLNPHTFGKTFIRALLPFLSAPFPLPGRFDTLISEQQCRESLKTTAVACRP